MEEFRPGSRFGDLQIEREIGRGAFGRVYLARDALIGRYVALKVVFGGGSEQESAQALREARAAGRLQSPHIITLFRVHDRREDGAWLFEMEYVPGGTLSTLLEREGALGAGEAVRIATGIATALSVAHEAGIVHGDVKPGNVLLDRDGLVKLADFGLARLVGEASLSHDDCSIVGTPLYMAPEVVMGESPTCASDIWSFGVVLYRMLAGRLPFETRSLPALFYAIEQHEPPDLDAAVPTALRDIAHRCMNKVPAQRPESFAAILAILAGRQVVAPAPKAASALLGRAEELQLLDAALQAAGGGTGGAAIITGEAGVGKTALARQVRKRAAGRGFVCIEAAVTPLRGLLRPLLEATRGVLESGLSPSSRSQLFESANSLVLKLLEEEAALKLEGRSQTVWALEQLMQGLAREFHVFLLVEDAHHADHEDFETLKHLVARLPAEAVLVLVVGRTGSDAIQQLVGSRVEAQHLKLEPLSREDTYRQLCQLAGVRHVAPEIAQRVYAVSRGNPLFTTELYRHLEESGTVRHAEDMLEPGRGWARTSFPDRFRELCTARLRGVSEEDRALLDVAAVDGLDLDGELLAAVSGEPLLAVLRRLQRLYREKAVVAPGPSGFRFTNAFFQEVIYQDLSPELRRATHLEVARNLAARDGAVDPERIGTHWELAGRPDDARPHLLEAALRAALRQELARAVDLAGRAGLRPDSLAPDIAVHHTRLVESLASCLHGQGKSEEAEALLRQLENRLDSDSNARLSVLTYRVGLGYYTHGVSEGDEAELDRAATVLPNGRGKARAHYLLGIIAKYRGDLETAEARFRQADEISRGEGLDALHSSALDQLASVALRQGRLREASALYQDAARIAERLGKRNNAATSRLNASLAALRSGRIEGIADAIEACITELDLSGADNLSAHATVHLARVRLAEGDTAAAARASREALARLRKSNYLPGLANALFTEAQLAAVQGDLERADACLREAREVAARRQSPDDLVRLGGLEALIASWWRDYGRAEQAVRTGLGTNAPPGLAMAEFVSFVAEACLFGLDPGKVEPVFGVQLETHGEDVAFRVGRTYAQAARGLAAGDAAAVEKAAESLRQSYPGEERATHRLFAGYLAARAHALRSNATEACASARAALQDARRCGHVWLEMLLLGLIVQQSGAGSADLQRCIARQASRIAAPDARKRLVAFPPI